MSALVAWSAPASMQGLPDTARWSVASVGPPAGAPIAPVVAGSMVIVPLQKGAIAGHRLGDGSHVWTIEQLVDKPLASDAERVFIAGSNVVVALDAATGAVAWRADVEGPPTAALLAHAGWVMAAAAGELIALRATDGHIIWRKPVGPVEFKPALDGDLLVVSVVDGEVIGLDVETGAERWRSDLGGSPSAPFAIGGRVFVGSRDKKFFSLHASSGRIDWGRFVGGLIMGSAAADERNVYFAALDNNLWAVDRRHGAIRWKKGLGYRPAAGPVVVGAHIVVPGRLESMPSFSAKTGDAGPKVGFSAMLAALPLVSRSEEGTPFVVAVTGSLNEKWTLSLFDPAPVPLLEMLPLSEIPGEVIPLPGSPGTEGPDESRLLKSRH